MLSLSAVDRAVTGLSPWLRTGSAPSDTSRGKSGGVPVPDDPRWPDLIGRFGDADAPGVRAIILVAADLISDTCGFAVPFMDYQGERTLHADYFGRKTDEQFAAYCAAKPHNAVSLDELPALPLPLPALPVPARSR